MIQPVKKAPTVSTFDSVDTEKSKPFENELVSKELKELLEKQIEHELFASRLYLHFSMWCRNNHLINTSIFFYKHSLEEQKHANAFINELSKLDICVVIPGTEKPDIEPTCLKDVIKETLKHEYFITDKIAKIRKLADDECPMILPLANAYLQEQIEELQLFNSLRSWYEVCCDDMPTFESEVLSIHDKTDHMIGTF